MAAIGAPLAYRAKVLAQSNPAATTSTDIYTVPAYTTTRITGVVVCNRNSSSGTFRLSVAVTGEALANKQYLFYDTAVPANESEVIMCDWLLGTTDKVRVYASDTNFSFTLFGVEEPQQGFT